MSDKPNGENGNEQSAPSLSDFIDSGVFRSNLIQASLFITLFEMLKNSVVSNVKGFFLNGDESKDSIGWADYKKHVLSLVPGEKRGDEAYVHMRWFIENSAITEEDFATFLKARDIRNRLAHEFPSLQDLKTPMAITDDFIGMAKLLEKIETWWFWEVEAAIMLPEERPDEDAEVIPGQIMMLKIMLNTAFDTWEKAT